MSIYIYFDRENGIWLTFANKFQCQNIEKCISPRVERIDFRFFGFFRCCSFFAVAICYEFQFQVRTVTVRSSTHTPFQICRV